MADTITPEKRSWIMSRIRSNGTKPEEFVRKYLFAAGLRYRKNDKRYPGKPDIVLPKYKTIVFINGCFWHAHDCKIGHMPKSNESFWTPKLERNKARDMEKQRLLKDLGWRVIVVWECELSTVKARQARCERLLDEIMDRES